MLHIETRKLGFQHEWKNSLTNCAEFPPFCMFDHSKEGERTEMKPRCIATSPIGGSLTMGKNTAALCSFVALMTVLRPFCCVFNP
jgi:hypothetical protein